MEQYKGEEMAVEEPADVHMEREETHQVRVVVFIPVMHVS
jgi:hypothetical protein